MTVRERPATHAVRHGMSNRQIARHRGTSVDAGHVTDIASRRSRRAVSHYWFHRQTSGKGRAPQRLGTRMIMNNTTGKPLAVATGASSGIGRELAARFAEPCGTSCATRA